MIPPHMLGEDHGAIRIDSRKKGARLQRGGELRSAANESTVRYNSRRNS